MRNHGRDPCGLQTHDPEVAKQTPYPLGHRSPSPSILQAERMVHCYNTQKIESLFSSAVVKNTAC